MRLFACPLCETEEDEHGSHAQKKEAHRDARNTRAQEEVRNWERQGDSRVSSRGRGRVSQSLGRTKRRGSLADIFRTLGSYGWRRRENPVKKVKTMAGRPSTKKSNNSANGKFYFYKLHSGTFLNLFP